MIAVEPHRRLGQIGRPGARHIAEGLRRAPRPLLPLRVDAGHAPVPDARGQIGGRRPVRALLLDVVQRPREIILRGQLQMGTRHVQQLRPGQPGPRHTHRRPGRRSSQHREKRPREHGEGVRRIETLQSVGVDRAQPQHIAAVGQVGHIEGLAGTGFLQQHLRAVARGQHLAEPRHRPGLRGQGEAQRELFKQARQGRYIGRRQQSHRRQRRLPRARQRTHARIHPHLRARSLQLDRAAQGFLPRGIGARPDAEPGAAHHGLGRRGEDAQILIGQAARVVLNVDLPLLQTQPGIGHQSVGVEAERVERQDAAGLQRQTGAVGQFDDGAARIRHLNLRAGGQGLARLGVLPGLSRLRPPAHRAESLHQLRLGGLLAQQVGREQQDGARRNLPWIAHPVVALDLRPLRRVSQIALSQTDEGVARPDGVAPHRFARDTGCGWCSLRQRQSRRQYRRHHPRENRQQQSAQAGGKTGEKQGGRETHLSHIRFEPPTKKRQTDILGPDAFKRRVQSSSSGGTVCGPSSALRARSKR
ncbi:hypothetical protein THICB3320179 [Thiomonas sp. CB3]|nr:hypothetical protein THICB3320179 [Thiomonas sp. CB3]